MYFRLSPVFFCKFSILEFLSWYDLILMYVGFWTKQMLAQLANFGRCMGWLCRLLCYCRPITGAVLVVCMIWPLGCLHQLISAVQKFVQIRLRTLLYWKLVLRCKLQGAFVWWFFAAWLHSTVPPGWRTVHASPHELDASCSPVPKVLWRMASAGRQSVRPLVALVSM